MRRTSVAVLAVLALAACSESPADSRVDSGALRPRFAASAAPEQVMPGEVLVKPREGVDVADVAAAHGLAVAARGYRDAFFVLRGAIGSERANAARLRQDARLVYAEPNFLRQPTGTPVRSELWAFHNPGGLNMNYTTGPNSGSPLPGSYASVGDADEDAAGGDINTTFGAGGSAVVIGSIDTGVDFSHSEFTGRLIAGKDWYNNDNDPSDDEGHGTHTTGTMAGRFVGVAGVTGATTNVRVYVQKVCGRRGCPTSAIVNAIMAAADYPGMVAMNLSLGGSSESSAEADAISYATSKNVLVIASAGNGGTGTVECPACDPNAISVAATNWQDKHTYYTNWGPGLDISAPGGECYSNTTPEGCIYSAVPGGYDWMQGTSMAAPQVTGTAAVAASVTGDRGAALRARIEGSADDLGAAGTDSDFGHGRLNTLRAVTGSGGGGGGGGTTLTASFSYSCSQATCNFDGSSSTGAVSYAWNFGDGGSATGATSSHTYGSAGNFDVVLTVTDASSNTAQSAPQTVSCALKGKSLKCH